MITTARSKGKTDNNSGTLFQEAMVSFETALSAAMTLHVESVQQCVKILQDAGSPLDWEKSLPGKVDKAIADVQQNVDRTVRFMNENAQRTVSLMETAMTEMRQSGSNGNEDHDFWSHALNAMHSNEQIIREANARVLESWRTLSTGAALRMAIVP